MSIGPRPSSVCIFDNESGVLMAASCVCERCSASVDVTNVAVDTEWERQWDTAIDAYW